MESVHDSRGNEHAGMASGAPRGVALDQEYGQRGGTGAKPGAQAYGGVQSGTAGYGGNAGTTGVVGRSRTRPMLSIGCEGCLVVMREDVMVQEVIAGGRQFSFCMGFRNDCYLHM